MAVEMEDLRTKISAECLAMINAEAASRGISQQEVTREILHRWSAQRVDAANVFAQLTKAQGILGKIG